MNQNSDPRDPVQQPGDPSVNPPPTEDPTQNPKDPCVKQPSQPNKG